MPVIYDNINTPLLQALQQTLSEATRSDFCVGYFNLRGWGQLGGFADHFQGTDESCCRVLVGMVRPPEEDMKDAQRAIRREAMLDNATVLRLKRAATESFKEQLEFGIPTNEAESTLRQLAAQLRARHVVVKLFLRHPLHAKLYIIHRPDIPVPIVGFLGSSNLTLSGLSGQGELNINVVEQDAAEKLQVWFDDRWKDRFALDISDDLAQLIEESWARELLVAPYHVYLKMAYYLSEEARDGEREVKLPGRLQGELLDFQKKAVSLTAHYLHLRGGVLLGDVVGLGKTLMATAVARIFQEDHRSNTLILCPPKLKEMWEWHVKQYDLIAEVLSLGNVINDLPDTRPYSLVIIDESHNLRNRDGARYRAIRDYIQQHDPRVLLLTATPYNKQFTDLSNQVRLFVDEDTDLHVRPEQFFQGWAEQGLIEADFVARYQASPRSLRAFEQSPFYSDWRDLMRLFLVRRTRHFIMQNYATFDEAKQRYFVTINKQPFFFPVRQPRKLEFALNEEDPSDPYARLYQEAVVKVIGDLALPRYGLVGYLVKDADRLADGDEKTILDNLNRAGRRLIGFCRTNLFKRLESSGYSFLLSLERHVLRNMVMVHALETKSPIPIGTQNAALLDTLVSDVDEDFSDAVEDQDPGEDADTDEASIGDGRYEFTDNIEVYKKRAEEVYGNYRTAFASRFQWLDTRFFAPELKKGLLADTNALLTILQRTSEWYPSRDTKLDVLHTLLAKMHPSDKVLVFTQFADTAAYLTGELKDRGVTDLACAAGFTKDPTGLARRFSPGSNGGLRSGQTELRVLIATDVLAEGQNLQDSHIIVNFDLPWAIIRLIQRAGRVDRIGQKHDTISVYSFWPADGVEKIIDLRRRLSQRLEDNQEVIGTDESFFGETAAIRLRDIYAGKKKGVFDGDEDEEVDLASAALQIWNSASEADRHIAQHLPPIVNATRPHPNQTDPGTDPPGVLTYLRFPDGTDALVRVDDTGGLVSQSLSTTFAVAACSPDTLPLTRADNHHDLVAACVQLAGQEQTSMGGQLGSLRSTRRKVYERLKRYRSVLQGKPNLFSGPVLDKLEPAFNAVLRYPLRESARDSLGRQVRLGITEDALAEMVIRLHEEERLSNILEESETPEPQVVCSLGLKVEPEKGE